MIAGLPFTSASNWDKKKQATKQVLSIIYVKRNYLFITLDLYILFFPFQILLFEIKFNLLNFIFFFIPIAVGTSVVGVCFRVCILK